ncbi:response regulator [Geomonas sp.]|uniref:response regulator n=1 Tax=Geomonas sp. TaxID=2651584 RepID=UPI002B46A323|nr:response regulator [Geomonas sp.]HJV33641.1 response regulator [Geomonas sp.]
MSRGSILLVDDDLHSLRILSMMLESRGYRVRAVSDGTQALEMMKLDRFGMLITDFEMPRMSGVELAIEVRAQHPDMQVVMVTGSNLQDIIVPAVQAGVSAIIRKPLDFAELMDVLGPSLPAPATPG